MAQEAVDKQEIGLQSVLHWVMDNCDNTEAMEKINKATWPFTSHYRTIPVKRFLPKTPTIDDDDEFGVEGFEL